MGNWAHFSHIPQGLLSTKYFLLPILITLSFTLHCTSAAVLSQTCSKSASLSFALSVGRVWLHLLYSAKNQEDKASLVLTAAEGWRTVLCTCLCFNPCGTLDMSSQHPRWSLSFCSWSAGYAETNGESAQILGYIRNYLGRLCVYSQWYMSLSTLQIPAPAVPDVESWFLHYCTSAQLHVIFSDWGSQTPHLKQLHPWNSRSLWYLILRRNSCHLKSVESSEMTAYSKHKMH